MTRLALYLVFLLALVAGIWDWWPETPPEALSGRSEAGKAYQVPSGHGPQPEQGRRMLVTEPPVPDTGDTLWLWPVSTAVVSDRGGNHVAVELADLGELAVVAGDGGLDSWRAEPATQEAVDGTATWYGWDFAGRPMANGAPYNPYGFTVASNRYRLGTKLLVEYRASVEVEVTDRGAFEHEIDMSIASFKALVGSLEPGRIQVTVREVR